MPTPRRHASSDSLHSASSPPGSPLSPLAPSPPSPSPSTISKRSSTGSLRSPVARRNPAEPTLLELMARASGEGDDDDAPPLLLRPSRRDAHDERRRSWEIDPPESAELHPPLYGRPGPSPSPDIFATLLSPLLSLSRPPTPPASPPTAFKFLPATVDRSASSLPAHFPPRTPSDPAPTVESQGFALYISSLVAWVAFLVWGLCPDETLDWIGIEWYPSREWALLFPAWTIMLAAFVYFSYIALNIFITPPLDSVHTLTDTQAYILPLPSSSTLRNAPHPLLTHSVLLPADAVPTLHDLPIGLVNRVVYGDYRRRRPRNRE
ncbi:hypothetical protein RQP46_010286 [Phenoliferia psychrophenolica]